MNSVHVFLPDNQRYADCRCNFEVVSQHFGLDGGFFSPCWVFLSFLYAELLPDCDKSPLPTLPERSPTHSHCCPLREHSQQPPLPCTEILTHRPHSPGHPSPLPCRAHGLCWAQAELQRCVSGRSPALCVGAKLVPCGRAFPLLYTSLAVLLFLVTL